MKDANLTASEGSKFHETFGTLGLEEAGKNRSHPSDRGPHASIAALVWTRHAWMQRWRHAHLFRRPMNNKASCRFCGGALAEFVDLGMSPLCESYIAKEQLNSMEPFYPLAAYVCRGYVLVQLQEFVAPEDIFSEYAYFSSYSDAWLDHARRYVETITERFGLGPASRIIELGSNDGYLLQYFVERGGPGPRHRPGGECGQGR
jgi:hypothetical protein